MRATATPPAADLFPCDTSAALAAACEQRFVRQQVRGGLHLDCELALSQDWQAHLPARSNADPFGFQCFAAWKHRDIPRAAIDLSAALLPREAHPADWLDIVIEHRGETVLARREFDAPAGRLPDLLTRGGPAGDAAISRMTAIKDADRLILLRTRAPASEYASIATECLITHASLRLLDAQRQPFAQPMHVFGGLDPAFRFAYPQSWSIDRKITRFLPGRATVRLDHFWEGVPVGRLDLDVRRFDDSLTPAALIEPFTTGLAARGVVFESAPLAVERPTRWVQTVRGFCAAATLGADALECRVAVLEHPVAMALIGCTGPARTMLSQAWAWNRRAFEIVRDSLQVAWT